MDPAYAEAKTHIQLDASDPASTATIEDIVSAIQGLATSLRQTAFYQHLVSALQEFSNDATRRTRRRVVQIVALGVGDFTRGANKQSTMLHCMVT